MIILFGVVGSGKSEQAKRLVAKLKCPHVSTSRLLREDLTPEHQAIMQAGKLVDDDNIFELLEPEFKRIDADHHEFILDGAPSSVGQAEWLLSKVKAGELKLTAIIHLKVPRDLILKRLLARGREDDQGGIIARRIEEYDNVTTPVLDYFRSQGYAVHQIDGGGSLGEVERQVWQTIKDKVDEAQER